MLRLLLILFTTGISAPLMAHGAWESHATLKRGESECQVTVSLSTFFALRLLPPSSRNTPLDSARFESLVDTFKQAASQVCDLRDSSGHPLKPVAIDVSLIDDHEVRFLLLFEAPPVELRLPFLADAPREAFCDVVLIDPPAAPRKLTLRPHRPRLPLARLPAAPTTADAP